MGYVGGALAGGLVLITYLGAILLCGLALRGVGSRADAQIWRVIPLALALLAIEKAFHAEALLVNRLGRIAQGGGWYVARRGVQIEAIMALAMIGVLLAAATAWLSRRAHQSARIAGIATSLLAAFVAIRAVSLHQLDRLLASGVGPLRLSNIVELAALGVIGGAAWIAAQCVRRSKMAVDK